MTLPIYPNTINLVNVELEYGGYDPISIDEYYGQGYVPSSGQISMQDFLQPQSTYTSPVSSGLLFELDARFDSSYPLESQNKVVYPGINSLSGIATTWYDKTVNQRDWTLFNSPTFSKKTRDFYFDGVNDYTAFRDASWIPEGTSAKTFDCYVKMIAWRTGQTAFLTSKTSPSNQSCSFGFKESSGVVTLILGTQGALGNFSDTTDFYTLPTPSNYLNSYHQYAFTYDGDIAKMYIDGSLVFTSASGKQFGNNSAAMRMMVFDPTNNPFYWPVNGYMQGARMYDRALSDAEISTNYSSWTSTYSNEPIDSVVKLFPLYHNGSTTPLTFTFNQSVADFVSADITVTNATVGTFTGVTTSQYTLSVVPTSTSTINVGVATTASYNAGNKNNNLININLPYQTFVTSGLVVRLDASNSSSYPGTGSTWFDISGNATTYDATLVNTPTFNSTAPKSFSFDGSTQYASIGAAVRDNMSVACWINTTTANGTGSTTNFWNGAGIIDTEGSGQSDFGLTMSGGYILFGTGNFTARRSNSTLNDGTWHYAVATRNTSTGEEILYIDGVQNDSGTGRTGSLTNYSNIHIGRTLSGARYFTGSISQVQIWDSILSSYDVTTHWIHQKAYYGY